MTTIAENLHRFEHLRAFVEVDWSAFNDPPPVAGRLSGITVGVKDIIAVAAMQLEAGSEVLLGNRSEVDAAVIARLRALGAVIVGKTATHEFAMGDHVPFGRLATGVFPWNPLFVSGGSSSGSAIAVAAALCDIALGSDTGGSVRGPAAACGVVGFVPGASILNRDGVIPLCWTLDRLGWMARSVDTVGRVHHAVTGTPKMRRDQPPRIGIPSKEWIGELHPEVDVAFYAALDKFRELGATVQTLGLPPRLMTSECWMDHLAEAYQYHAVRLADPTQPYSAGLRSQLELAGAAPVERYLEAVDFRRRFAEQMTTTLDAVDVLVLPTTPFPALQADKLGADVEPWFCLTVPFNLSGHPCLTLPCGWDSQSVPIGLQIVAQHGNEPGLLSAGQWCESAVRFIRRTP
jgi:aspartyl-tRNA(Asn)/glutamyl-tRNA(Gln) amidotransferase subunit A